MKLILHILFLSFAFNLFAVNSRSEYISLWKKSAINHMIQYKIPARFNDLLKIQTNCIKANDYSFTLKQNIMRENQVISEAKVEIVCIGADIFKPVRIPKIAKKLMEIL